MSRQAQKMTDPHVQGADRATSRQWQGYLRCAAERAALWWVAHVVEAIFVFAMLIAVLAAIFGALPNADLSGLFLEKSCCRGAE
jgi:hypothetical protein